MANPVNSIIKRWRNYRNIQMLRPCSSGSYAFVGVGHHALQNLYPVLQYLGVELKYICCKSEAKMPLIEKKFGVRATTNLDDILRDDEIKGVFVCTSPDSHYEICRRILKAGKFLFVEKPPCQSLDQLQRLVVLDTNSMAMVGMQKRFSPFMEILKKRLRGSHTAIYSLTYQTGSYPEGDALTELFIHPIDMTAYLFGHAEIIGCNRHLVNGTETYQLLLSHEKAKGVIELSTAYSWLTPVESLRVNSTDEEYRLEDMEKLSAVSHPSKLFGVPTEKLGLHKHKEVTLLERINFSPLLADNQLYSQGFVNEIKAFVNMVENDGVNPSPLSGMLETYKIINSLAIK